MENYEFVLTPGYCLYNCAAVKNQKGSEICFLVENPYDEELKHRLEKAFRGFVEQVNRQEDCPEIFKKEIKVRFISGNRTDLKKCISALYEKRQKGSFCVAEKSVTYGKEESEDLKALDENGAAIVLLDSILNEARMQGATDIHIENNEVKFRMKGRLGVFMKLQKENCEQLVGRIKLVSGMNVIEKRRSQDGNFTAAFGEKEKLGDLYVRVSVVPVVKKNREDCGESVVMRLLDPERLPLEVEKLGFNNNQVEKIRLLGGYRNGLVLICGPTGAGKSTTAASILMELRKEKGEGLKIISLEDPPEYVIPGVSQIKIDEKEANSFEEMLKHIFRQDPDVIMIGEIRDEISALAALRAGLTGHLVFATVHTSSAGEALLRLENLGLERKLVSSVLRGVIVQELEYYDQDSILLADVCMPGEGVSKKVMPEMGIEELEDLFVHEVNGGEVLAKTAKILSKTNEDPAEDNSYRRRKNRKSVVPVFEMGGKVNLLVDEA